MAEAIRGALDGNDELDKFHTLHSAFAAVARYAPKDQFAAVVDRTVGWMKGTGHPETFSNLARAFAVVAKGATAPGQSAVIVKAFVEARALEENEPQRLADLAQAFAPLVEGATSELSSVIVETLVKAIARHENAHWPDGLADAFARAAKKATAEQKAAVVPLLVQEMNSERDPSRLSSLIRAYSEVAEAATAKQFDAVRGAVFNVVQRGSDPNRFSALRDALIQLAERSSPKQRRWLFVEVNSAMYSQGDPRMLDAWAGFIRSQVTPSDREDQREAVDRDDLGNILTDANCVGSVRTAVLEKLAQSLDIPWKASDDPWRMITDEKVKPFLPPVAR
jgi:hypothetical protein